MRRKRLLRGTCISEGGKPVCTCGAWEQAAGLTCEFRGAGPPPDDHGNDFDSATLLVASTTATPSTLRPPFRGSPDLDYFTFTAEAGHTYRFDCVPGAELDRCDVRLLTGPAGPRPLPESGVRWLHVAVTTRLYLEVSGGGTQSTGTYTYQLQDLGPDVHADRRRDVTSVQAAGEDFSMVLHPHADTDVVAFRPTAGHGYHLTCKVEYGSGVGLVLVDAVGASVVPPGSMTDGFSMKAGEDAR
jgi:hypothetical protein